MRAEKTKIGKRGTVVIPAGLCKSHGLEEGSLVIVEALPQGVLLRPVVTLPVEIYTPERKAAFLLSTRLFSGDLAK